MPNKTLDRMTRSAVSRVFQDGGPLRAPRHRSAAFGGSMMKRPTNLLALALGSLHFAFCVLFFTFYFRSNDPQRAMALVILMPADPWIIPLSSVPVNESVLAFIVTTVGTAQWWAVGWLIMKGAALFSRRKPNQQGGANGEQPSGSDPNRESSAATPRRSP